MAHAKPKFLCGIFWLVGTPPQCFLAMPSNYKVLFPGRSGVWNKRYPQQIWHKNILALQKVLV